LTYYDPVINDIGKALNLTLNQRFLKTGGIRQLIADSKKKFYKYTTDIGKVITPVKPLFSRLTEVIF